MLKNSTFRFFGIDFKQFKSNISTKNVLFFLRRAKLICPWGIEGAIAVDNETDSHFAALAKPPAKVVDSLGAGDTFVASTIRMLSHGSPIQEAIEFGCRIAGAKVGSVGFDSIGSLI